MKKYNDYDAITKDKMDKAYSLLEKALENPYFGEIKRLKAAKAFNKIRVKIYLAQTLNEFSFLWWYTKKVIDINISLLKLYIKSIFK